MDNQSKKADTFFNRTPKMQDQVKKGDDNSEQITSRRVLICGDRNWGNGERDYSQMEQFIKTLPDDTLIIHGAAKGADSMAGEIAKERGLAVEAYPADWKQYGRAAGPIRNKQMLDEGRPDLVVGFHRSFEASKGTKDMINRAKKDSIETKVFS